MYICYLHIGLGYIKCSRSSNNDSSSKYLNYFPTITEYYIQTYKYQIVCI